MNPVLWMVVLFGLVGPFLTFGVGFAIVIKTLVALFSAYMADEKLSALQGKKAGSEFIDPNQKDAFLA